MTLWRPNTFRLSQCRSTTFFLDNIYIDAGVNGILKAFMVALGMSYSGSRSELASILHGSFAEREFCREPELKEGNGQSLFVSAFFYKNICPES